MCRNCNILDNSSDKQEFPVCEVFIQNNEKKKKKINYFLDLSKRY